MICVTIARNRHRMIVGEHRALAERGAELVELRVDYLSKAPVLRILLHERPTPVIITCRRPQDGGMFKGSEQQRIMLLRQAVADEADFVDLEEDIAAAIPRYGKTKRIVSYHNFDETPDDLPAIHARLAGLDADIVKLATMAKSPADNARMLRLVAESKMPIVGLCMGQMGLPSRVLNRKYGSPFTFASTARGSAVAPGQVSFDEMRDIYRYDAINRETEIYGVVGDPVAHSLSPLLHNTVFAELSLNKVYVPWQVPAGTLRETLEELNWLDLKGLSVTIPHKEDAVALADEVERGAKQIGAANTLVREDGRWHAYNTDANAARQSLEAAFGQSGSDASPLAGKCVLILGAGGAARAIAFALVGRGARVTISGRTPERAKQLAEAVSGEHVSWDERASIEADCLVNATPIGMHPNVEETPVDGSYLKPGMVVFDTVYRPEVTRLIREARERGATTVVGTEMFVRQAAGQVKLFTGHDAPVDLLRNVFAEAPSRRGA